MKCLLGNAEGLLCIFIYKRVDSQNCFQSAKVEYNKIFVPAVSLRKRSANTSAFNGSLPLSRSKSLAESDQM